MLGIRDVAAHLQVSHQRAAQMRREGKLPEPDQVDSAGPMWKPATIENGPIASVRGRGGEEGGREGTG